MPSLPASLGRSLARPLIALGLCGLLAGCVRNDGPMPDTAGDPAAAPERTPGATSDPLATEAAGTETPRGVETYRVGGIVTHDGQPVKSGEITYTPVDGGEPVRAPITDGRYELRAPTGRHRVSITGEGLPAEVTGRTYERPVLPDTTQNVHNFALPDAEPTTGSTPAEVRERFDGK